SGQAPVAAPDRSAARRDAWGTEVSATRAVAARAWRYWRTDPRYLSGMIATIILPVVIIFLLGGIVLLPTALILGLGPLMAGTVGWGRHNDVAYDGTAFWM